jgi:outer membrane protein assembly factor BamB
MISFRSVVSFVVAMLVWGSAMATAGPGSAVILISPAVGPPTTKVTVTGTGFGLSEVVDLTLDGRPLSKVTSDPAGAFSKRIKVPRWAFPGDHDVTATGEVSQLTASALFTVRTDWPMFHLSEDRRGYNRYENVLSPSNVAGLSVKWRARGAVAIGGSPAVVDGAVYVGDYANTFYRFDAATGAVVWSVTLNAQWIASSPAVWNGMVFVGTGLGARLYALDAATGATVWFHQMGAGVHEDPVVSDGIVYIGSNDGFLYALDALTGSVQWTGSIRGDTGSPAVANGVVYVGGVDGGMYAFDAATGTKVWKITLSGFPATPAVSNGTVYVGTSSGPPSSNRFVALDADTGTRLWNYTVGSYVLAGPAVANGVVYVGDADGEFLALDADTGHVVWSATTGDAVISSAAVANGMVYVGSEDHFVYAFDAADGTVLWSYEAGGFVLSSPAVADGVVYVGSFDDYLYAFALPG